MSETGSSLTGTRAETPNITSSGSEKTHANPESGEESANTSVYSSEYNKSQTSNKQSSSGQSGTSKLSGASKLSGTQSQTPSSQNDSQTLKSRNLPKNLDSQADSETLSGSMSQSLANILKENSVSESHDKPWSSRGKEMLESMKHFTVPEIKNPISAFNKKPLPSLGSDVKSPESILDKLHSPGFEFKSPVSIFSKLPFPSLGKAGKIGDIRRGAHLDEVKTKPSQAGLLRHLAAVGECFQTLYTQDQFSDVLVHIDTHTFNAHKAILMAHSEILHKVLIETKGPVRTEIHLKGIPATSFRLILEYMYTSDIVLTLENVSDIYFASQQLIIPRLVEKCDLILADIKQNPVKALDILEMSTIRDSEIYKRVLNVVTTHFSDIIESPNLAKQPLENMMILLSSNDLVVNTEMDVFTAAKMWILHNQDERMKHAEKVFGAIRFPQMTPIQLLQCMDVMKTTGLMQAEKDIVDSMWYAVSRLYNYKPHIRLHIPPERHYKLPWDSSFPSMKRARTGSKETIAKKITNAIIDKTPGLENLLSGLKQTTTPAADTTEPTTAAADVTPDSTETEPESKGPPGQSILIVGGKSTNPSADPEIVGKLVVAYTPRNDSWRRVGELPEPRQLHAVAFMVDCLYVVGGSRPVEQYETFLVPSSTVFKWNLKSKQWNQCAPMNHRRIHHGICVLHHQLYVIGGQDECSKVLTSVESYNPIADGWNEVAPISIGRIGSGVATHEDMIMVAGGYRDVCSNTSGKFVIGSVEIYELKTNSWSLLSDLPYPRCHGGLVNVAGNLYYCGGATKIEYDTDRTPGVTSISNVDKYNKSVDRWEKLTNLRHRRHGAAVTAIGTKLYVFGGVSSIEQGPVVNVECLDVETGQVTKLDLKCDSQMGMGAAVCNTSLLPEASWK